MRGLFTSGVDGATWIGIKPSENKTGVTGSGMIKVGFRLAVPESGSVYSMSKDALLVTLAILGKFDNPKSSTCLTTGLRVNGLPASLRKMGLTGEIKSGEPFNGGVPNAGN